MASFFLKSLRSPAVHDVLKSTCVHRTVSRHIYISSRPQQRIHFPRTNNNRSTSRIYSTVVVQDRPRGRSRRIVTTVFLTLGSFLVGGYLALSYAPPLLTSLILGAMPSDEDSLKYEAPDEYTRQIDEHIKNSKFAKYLRAHGDFIESRPHMKIPEEMRHHNLTGGTLSGPDMIVVPPLIFNEKDGKSMVCLFYVGQHLSGHPGIVHGGFLATMLDEGLARCVFPVLPNKTAVTAQLNIAYKKPTMAGQFLVLMAQTTKHEGRKAWSTGGIWAMDDLTPEQAFSENFNSPTPLVTAEALYIEPKYASVSFSWSNPSIYLDIG